MVDGVCVGGGAGRTAGAAAVGTSGVLTGAAAAGRVGGGMVVGATVLVVVAVTGGGAPATSTISIWLGLSRIISGWPAKRWISPVMRTRLPA